MTETVRIGRDVKATVGVGPLALVTSSVEKAIGPGAMLRVATAPAYLICAFPRGAAPTMTDPIGDLRESDIRALFGGSLRYYCEQGSAEGYTEMILNINETS